MSKSLEFVHGTNKFNYRVLSSGHVDNTDTRIHQLKSKLFFNTIYTSNMNEVFQKYPDNITNGLDYNEGISKYIYQVDSIVESFTNLYEAEISMFYNSNLSNDIIELLDQDDWFSVSTYRNYNIKNIVFDDNHMYYYGSKGKSVVIASINKNADILKNIFSKNDITYWKTNDVIRTYLESKLGIKLIEFIVTLEKETDLVTKVEYNGNLEWAPSISYLFDIACMYWNPFIYVKDINKIMGQYETEEIIEMKNYPNVTIDSILEKDILTEYPNDSFDSYLNLLREASEDNRVKSISMTLYRIGDSCEIYDILSSAVSNNKIVNVNIELCASGEEERNNSWKQLLEDNGINVSTYKSGHFKVHSKVTLIELTDSRYISQIGTGNYHTETTSQYTDLSLYTSDHKIGSKVKMLFELLMNGIRRKHLKFNKDLLVTRFNCRDAIIKMIDREADLKSKGYIGIKCNALDDDEIGKHISRACQMGCRVDLIVRGPCTIEVPLYSRNITIKSFVWDKLEHSRLYIFGRSLRDVYIGSLDLVSNKINKRIETLVRVKDINIVKQLSYYFNRYVNNTRYAWIKVNNDYVKL